MLKVIVADDENRICRLITMLVDWQALGMEVVATASNGLEALDYIEKLQPDILITDIHMPGCNGLELIEKAKAMRPHLEIIIVSGYAYFDYAQTAIKHGVGEYLLKPIQQQELVASLKKLGERCLQQRLVDAEMTNLKQSYLAQINQMQEQFVRDLMHNQVKELTYQAIEKQYHLSLQNQPLQVFLLKLDYQPDAFSEASLDIILEKARYILHALLTPLCSTFLLHFNRYDGCCLISYPDDFRKKVRSAVREAVNQLTAQRPLYGAIEFSIGMGDAVDSPHMLPESIKSAQSAVAQRLIEGTGKLLEPTMPSAHRQEDDPILRRYRISIGHAVELIDRKAALAAVDQMEQEAYAIADFSGEDYLELVKSAGKLFLLQINCPNREELLAQFELLCTQCYSRKMLFDRLRTLLTEQIDYLQTTRDNEAAKPIRIAKKYVQEHYSQPITLEDVCAVTGFSVSYFSVLFKKETGEGFSKYLAGVRIERAKELLQETDLSVADICQAVGYSDTKHFVQTFRKATGLNPAQYRKLYG